MSMTFDDGVLSVYRLTNTAPAGKKPVLNPLLYCQYYYHIETIGVVRYYQAMQANAKVDALVSIPDWEFDIGENDIVVLDSADGGNQYRVDFIQRTYESGGLKVRRLSLVRLGENYAI